jgi:Fibronectin type III domain
MTGEGPPSAIVQSRPVPPAPQPPTQLTAQAALGQVTLSWQASPTGSVYYWVYFRRPGQSWYYLPYPTLQTTMTVRPLLPGATYEFKVTAANLGGQSAPTNVVSVTVPLPHVVTGVRVTPGVYAATVSWNAVAGADSYQVYGYFVPLGQLNFAPSPSQMHLLKWGITGTSWTHQYLLDKGYYWYMVTAVKLGVEGPGNRSSMGWTTPYMNNDDYYYARNRFFDLPADPPDQRAVVNVGGGPDHGIVIGRGFIQPRTPLDHVIGNERGYSDDPYASSKVEVAWDTRTGEVSVYIEHSCVHPLGGLSGYCKDALPIQFVDLMPPYDDSTALCCNILEVRKTSAGVLYVAWKASNSITPSLGHIDGSFLLTPSGGGYNVNLDADRYPSYEFYRYPHYTVLGFTDSEWMGTRGQTIVQDLKLPETSQTHCASTWPWPFGRPLAC